MDIVSLDLPEVKILSPRKFGDARGFFSETYNRDAFAAAGLDHVFVQDNHSFSATPGTLRGLHFQLPPYAQDKLVRVTRGAIFDVAVDIRRGSPTFGRWVGAEIAHGFCTLAPDTEVIYKVTAPYAPESERGIAWDDPQLAIDWPLPVARPILSGKDGENPLLADSAEVF